MHEFFLSRFSENDFVHFILFEFGVMVPVDSGFLERTRQVETLGQTLVAGPIQDQARSSV